MTFPLSKSRKALVAIVRAAAFTFLIILITLLGFGGPFDKERRAVESLLEVLPNLIILVAAGLIAWAAQRQLPKGFDTEPAYLWYVENPGAGAWGAWCWPAVFVLFAGQCGAKDAFLLLLAPGVIVATVFMWELHHPDSIDVPPLPQEPDEPYYLAAPNDAVLLWRLLIHCFWGIVCVVSAANCPFATVLFVCNLLIAGGTLWNDLCVSPTILSAIAFEPIIIFVSYKVGDFAAVPPFFTAKNPNRFNQVVEVAIPTEATPFQNPFL